MDGFSADPQDLQRAAEAMQRLGSDLRDSSALKYSIMSRSVGHPELGEALSDLDKASHCAISALLEKTTTAARRVKLTVDEYQRVDEVIADALARFDRSDATLSEPDDW